MSCAATESIDLRLMPRRRLSASTEVYRSSTRATGSLNLPSSRRANLSTRPASGCAPCSRTGRPTTSRAGRHSATSFSISANPAIAGSGGAVASSGSPTATPMRFRPKSKARTVRAARSGMSRFVLQPRVVEAEELHRRRQAFFGRRVEDDGVACFHGGPRVLRQLVLELAGRPAGVAEGHQHALGTFAAAYRLEDVLGRGEADHVAHAQCRLPVARRLVQHEAAIGLHRAAEIDRRCGQRTGAYTERT